MQHLLGSRLFFFPPGIFYKAHLIVLTVLYSKYYDYFCERE